MALKRLLWLLLLIPFVSEGQTIQVRKEHANIGGERTPGYQIAFTASEDEVRSSLLRYLKDIGKVRSADDYLTTSEAVVGGRKYNAPILATTRQVGTTTAAWIGMRPAGEESAGGAALEKLLYDFGVTFLREQIQTQIDESLRALHAVERQQSKLRNQNRDLGNRIESNKREKIALEKSLVENKVELETLTRNIEANVRAQDSIATAMEQIRKVVEMHQERQRKVQ